LVLKKNITNYDINHDNIFSIRIVIYVITSRGKFGRSDETSHYQNKNLKDFYFDEGSYAQKDNKSKGFIIFSRNNVGLVSKI
jgi:hypothetical protein